MNINFINNKTGETKLKVEYDEKFNFNSSCNPKETLGTLKVKPKASDKEIEINVYSMEEKDDEIVVNDYIHISKEL